MPHLVHTSSVSVRWGDMDAFGHVNNSRYFTYFEQARVDWMRTLPGDGFPEGLLAVLAETRCAFKRPLTYPDALHVDVSIDPPGRSSLQTYYTIRRAGTETVIAEGDGRMVWVSRDSGRPVSIPPRLRTALDACLDPHEKP